MTSRFALLASDSDSDGSDSDTGGRAPVKTPQPPQKPQKPQTQVQHHQQTAANYGAFNAGAATTRDAPITLDSGDSGFKAVPKKRTGKFSGSNSAQLNKNALLAQEIQLERQAEAGGGGSAAVGAAHTGA